jgi:hypothetical protein
MPELLEFQAVIESHPVVVAVMVIGVALAAAAITRWVDQSALDTAHERSAAYEDEVNRLNDARADLLARLEERGSELRRTKADLARREGWSRSDSERSRASAPHTADPTEEASIGTGQRFRDPLRPR